MSIQLTESSEAISFEEKEILKENTSGKLTGLKSFKFGWVFFAISMLLFHYHSTVHFIWVLLRIPFKFPIDPVEGWWSFLKGLLPALSLFVAFFAGISLKHKTKK